MIGTEIEKPPSLRRFSPFLFCAGSLPSSHRHFPSFLRFFLYSWWFLYLCPYHCCHDICLFRSSVGRTLGNYCCILCPHLNGLLSFPVSCPLAPHLLSLSVFPSLGICICSFLVICFPCWLGSLTFLSCACLPAPGWRPWLQCAPLSLGPHHLYLVCSWPCNPLCSACGFCNCCPTFGCSCNLWLGDPSCYMRSIPSLSLWSFPCWTFGSCVRMVFVVLPSLLCAHCTTKTSWSCCPCTT